jgi:hypothetical protein
MPVVYQVVYALPSLLALPHLQSPSKAHKEEARKWYQAACRIRDECWGPGMTFLFENIFADKLRTIRRHVKL